MFCLPEELIYLILDKLDYITLLNLRLVNKNNYLNIKRYFYFKYLLIFKIKNNNFVKIYKNFKLYNSNELLKFIKNERNIYNLFVIENHIKNDYIDKNLIYELVSKVPIKNINLDNSRLRLISIDTSYLRYKKHIIKFLYNNHKELLNFDTQYNLAELFAIYGDFVLLRYSLLYLNYKIEKNFYDEWKRNFMLLNSSLLYYDIKTDSIKNNYNTIDNILLNYFSG